MSDFLTRLAERTLGVAPTVQPVLAPLFAPSPLVAEEWIASDVSGFVAEQDGDIRRRVPISWVPTRGTPQHLL